MADTSALKEVAQYAVHQLSITLNTELSRKAVAIGSQNRTKKFDGVSSDGNIIVKVLNHSGTTSGGNKPSAKIRSTFADCFFLSITRAERKILALTNKEFYDIFVIESDGLLSGIEIIYVDLPEQYKAIADKVSSQASDEMTR